MTLESAPEPTLAAELLHTEVVVDGAGTVVALAGEVDMANAAALRRVLHEVIAAQPATVTINARDLTFIDSCGMHCLVEAAADASAKGSALFVVGATRVVRRVIALWDAEDLLLRGGVEGDQRERPLRS